MAVNNSHCNKLTTLMYFSIALVRTLTRESYAGLFAAVDLRSGFWQVSMNPQTKHNLNAACITFTQVHEWECMSFGLTNKLNKIPDAYAERF
jgi:hypothetical protein